MKKWKCNLCGYIYDPARDSGPPGELAGAAQCKNIDENEELVETFKCPQCHAPKKAFRNYEGKL